AGAEESPSRKQNLATRTGRNPRPSRIRPLPMAFLAALATMAHPVLTAALCRWSDIILYQERGASESSSWLMGVPVLVRVTATGHLIEPGGLHIRDFYYPRALCLRSVAHHFAAPRQSAEAIDRTSDRARGMSRMPPAAPPHTS